MGKAWAENMKIGFLCGIGGNRNGIGEYFARVTAAGKSICLGSYDDYGVIQEALTYPGQHHLFFRPTPYPWENPDFSLPPSVAGANYWQFVKSKLPAEFDKERVWVVWANEGPKELSYADWWGECAQAVAHAALTDGYRTLAWGWSWGTPDEGFWSQPSVIEYLRLCSANPLSVGIAFHEGSDPRIPGDSPLISADPAGSGRFQEAFNSARLHGLNLPTVFITECAWHHDSCPPLEIGMEHVAAAAAFYDQFASVQCVALWYLGGGEQWGALSDKLQPYIQPVANLSIAWPTEVKPPMTLNEALIAAGNAQQILRLNPGAALQKAIYAAGLQITSAEFDLEHEGITYRAQRGEPFTKNGPVIFYCQIGDWANVKSTLTEPGVAKLFSILLPPGVRGVIPNGGRFGDRRSYGMHEGLDLALSLGTPFGINHECRVLSRGFSPTGYGNFVQVGLTVGEASLILWFGHARDPIAWTTGQIIPAGRTIGYVGSSGNSTGPHLHTTVQWPGHGEDGYIKSDVVDPETYVDISFVATLPPRTLPTMYDALAYMGGGVSAEMPFGRIFEVRSPSGAQQTHQTQYDVATRRTYQVKGAVGQPCEWEEFWADQVNVYRFRDCSAGGGKMYQLTQGGTEGSAWIPRMVSVGQVFRRIPDITWFNLSDCTQTEVTRAAESWIKVVAHYDEWVTPYGIKIADVLEFQWLSLPESTSPIETYFYSKDGWGLSGWGNSNKGIAGVCEVHQPGARPNLERRQAC